MSKNSLLIILKTVCNLVHVAWIFANLTYAQIRLINITAQAHPATDSINHYPGSSKSSCCLKLAIDNSYHHENSFAYSSGFDETIEQKASDVPGSSTEDPIFASLEAEGNGPSGLIPTLLMLAPEGVWYRATVTDTADPSERGTTVWMRPLPNVVSPRTRARPLS